jgi:hypothetical protein
MDELINLDIELTKAAVSVLKGPYGSYGSPEAELRNAATAYLTDTFNRAAGKKPVKNVDVPLTSKNLEARGGYQENVGGCPAEGCGAG